MEKDRLYERFEKYLDADNLFPHHDCGLCGDFVGYWKSNGRIVFDSNCSCVRYYSEPRLVEKSEIDLMLSGNPDGWPKYFEKTLSEKGF